MLVALALGVASVLAVIAFISHNAHAMEVSEILEDVTEATLGVIDSRWPARGERVEREAPEDRGGEALVVTFAESGWVEAIDPGALLGVLDGPGVVTLEVAVGRYAVEGVPLAAVQPAPSDPERAADQARRAVVLGRTRTLAQDPAYGLRQLVDVGLRALSAGVDDPTTAQDAIFHVAAVLRRVQSRTPPARVVRGEGRRFVEMAEMPGHEALVRLGFDELRRSAARHPSVAVYLLEALHSLCRADPPAPEVAREAMREQAGLIAEGAALAELLPADRRWVWEAYASRFDAAGDFRLDRAPRA